MTGEALLMQAKRLQAGKPGGADGSGHDTPDTTGVGTPSDPNPETKTATEIFVRSPTSVYPSPVLAAQ